MSAFDLVCSAILNLVCSATLNLVFSAILNLVCSATLNLVCCAICFSLQCDFEYSLQYDFNLVCSAIYFSLQCDLFILPCPFWATASKRGRKHRRQTGRVEVNSTFLVSRRQGPGQPAMSAACLRQTFTYAGGYRR